MSAPAVMGPFSRRLAAAFAAPVLLAGAAHGADLTAAQLVKDGEGFLFAFRFDRPVTFLHTPYSDPPRIAIDIPASRLAEGVAPVSFRYPLVEGIRYGVQPDGDLRIVIDLGAPVTYALGRLPGEEATLRLALTLNLDGEFQRRPLLPAPPTPQGRPAAPSPRAEGLRPAAMRAPLPEVGVDELECVSQFDDTAECGRLFAPGATRAAPADETAPPDERAAPGPSSPLPPRVEGHASAAPPPGSFGVHRFTKDPVTGKRRHDVGYQTHFGDAELGVSVLRPGVTWQTPAVGGHVRMRLEPDELRFGYQKQWE